MSGTSASVSQNQQIRADPGQLHESGTHLVSAAVALDSDVGRQTPKGVLQSPHADSVAPPSPEMSTDLLLGVSLQCPAIRAHTQTEGVRYDTYAAGACKHPDDSGVTGTQESVLGSRLQVTPGTDAICMQSADIKGGISRQMVQLRALWGRAARGGGGGHVVHVCDPVQGHCTRCCQPVQHPGPKKVGRGLQAAPQQHVRDSGLGHPAPPRLERRLCMRPEPSWPLLLLRSSGVLFDCSPQYENAISQ